MPHCSILGSVLFNVFIDDTFLFVKDSTLYNYADDNTVSICDNDIDVVTKTLENDSMELINWFSLNLMTANPDKFQAIAIGKKNRKVKIYLLI